MMKILILGWMLTSVAHAWTLNNNFGASFSKSNVKVLIDKSTTCADAGTTISELQDFIDPAIDDFWNRVPTSKLRLKNGGTTGPINNINSGRLCAPTDDDCIDTAGTTVIAPVSDIVIACNDLNTNFSNSTSVVAVTIPNSFSGKKIKGAVILINNTPNSAFANLSQADKIAVISHEIGHAIGLGHSEEKASLMYYRTVDLRKSLGQDDIDGVSYLYPVKLDGCGLMGGTIDTDRIDPQFLQLGIGFFFILLLAKLKGLFRRPEARSAA